MSNPTGPAGLTDYDLARTALLEITTAETIGANAGSVDEGDGTVTVYFETTQPGYVGWLWTVSIAHVDGLEPSVLETELTPGEGALLSPTWVPWADRMADYTEAQAALADQESDADAESDDDDDDDDDFDDNDVNDDDEALLHSGDLDGVDIDSLDPDDSDAGGNEEDVARSAPDAAESAAVSARSNGGVDEEQEAEPDAAQAQMKRRAPRRRASSKNRN